MGIVEVVELTNQDPRFYSLIGPFLARRAVVRVVGGPLWDDDGKVWFAAVSGDQVVGFAAITRGKGVATLCSDYAPAGDDWRIVMDLLLQARLRHLEGEVKEVQAVVSRQDLLRWEQAGFVPARSTKQFVKVAKCLSA